jgi:large subunit ribosomal protein L25
MAEIALIAEARTENGTRPSKRLRATGRIPAIIYGHGVRPVPISVDARDLRLALSSEAGANALFEIAVNGERHLAIARELQRHPVRHTVAHVDFQVVRRDEVVPADVPLNLVGEALATTRAGGSIEHLVLSLHVRAKPAEIPVAFEVDISDLEIGGTIRLGEIVVPSGVTIEGDPEMSVVIAHPPRVATAEETAAEEAAAEPAAAGEAAPEEH